MCVGGWVGESRSNNAAGLFEEVNEEEHAFQTLLRCRKAPHMLCI